MAFYRKNIGSLEQIARVAAGVAVAALALVYYPGLVGWLVAAGSLGFSLTGLIGYCPMCAIAGVDRSTSSKACR